MIKGKDRTEQKVNCVVAGSLTGRNHVGVKFYYVIRILEEVVDFGIWEDGVLYDGRESANCSNCGVYAGIYSQDLRKRIASSCI